MKVTEEWHQKTTQTWVAVVTKDHDMWNVEYECFWYEEEPEEMYRVIRQVRMAGMDKDEESPAILQEIEGIVQEHTGLCLTS